MKSDSTKMGRDHCPYCKAMVDTASPVNPGEVPDPGDVSVCFYCGEFMKYGDDMRLEKLTQREFNQIPHSDRLKMIKIKIAILNARDEEKNL